MEQPLAELKERLGKLTDLRRTEAVLLWDMTVFMPPGGAPTRAAQLGTLEEIVHAHVVDERFGELFEELEPYASSLPHDSDDASLIRVAQRDWNRARRVPSELAVEFAKTAAESYEVWVKAREESDFAAFRPVARADRGSAPAVHRVLRAVRRRVRRASRGLRARDAHVRDSRGLLGARSRAPRTRRRARDRRGRRVHARAVPDRRRRRRSHASWSRPSARPGTSSASTRRCTRSRSPSGSATFA